MGSRFSDFRYKRATQLATTLIAVSSMYSLDAQDVAPLPSEVFGGQPSTENPIMSLTGRAISETGLNLEPEIPDNLTINNEGGDVLYDNSKRTLTYKGNNAPVRFLTDEGLEVVAREVTVDLENKKVTLTGPLTIYRGESLTLAEGGTYDWKNSTMEAHKVRSKVTGILVRGSKVEYARDKEGKSYMRIQDAYVSTDDSQNPDTWVGTGEMTVYPGDYGRVTRMSIASGDYDVAIPILGWFSFSHSLNPREGYMPNLGAKSIWGSYMLNSYGFLLGNRRVEDNMPVSDYILTTHLDYRTRRGLAGGIDLEDVGMSKKYRDMKGIEAYYVYDRKPNINPTSTGRIPTSHDRYRFAMSTLWDLPVAAPNPYVRWTTVANINVLSDRYVLRDYFDDICKVNDKPDNTIRVVRRGKLSQTMLMTRFAPNDYYTTDERAELSYYRARTAIGKTGISYETRNSLGMMRQEVSAQERAAYRAELDNLYDPDARAYYERLLDTHSYFRAHSSHEFSTTFDVMRFLNITPKAGAGYTGYYGVDGPGADNRFLGFLGVDANIKFHKHYDSFNIPSLGYKGLTHVFKPYTTLSHCSISSANNAVPQVDSWANEFGTITSNPMELDLMGFSGIDSWGTWTIWRIGMENRFTTTVDGERRTLLKWNCFFDYNEENPNSPNKFSNLYSLVNFSPTRTLSFYLNTQTPTFDNGDGYREINTGLTWQPLAALETRVGYRSLKGHSVQRDAEQMKLRANLRINEKYSFACQWNWDIEHKRVTIQQYSLFRKAGAWYMGATLFLRDNGGKSETGFGISFTLAETGTALPVSFF